MIVDIFEKELFSNALDQAMKPERLRAFQEVAHEHAKPHKRLRRQVRGRVFDKGRERYLAHVRAEVRMGFERRNADYAVEQERAERSRIIRIRKGRDDAAHGRCLRLRKER